MNTHRECQSEGRGVTMWKHQFNTVLLKRNFSFSHLSLGGLEVGHYCEMFSALNKKTHTLFFVDWWIKRPLFTASEINLFILHDVFSAESQEQQVLRAAPTGPSSIQLTWRVIQSSRGYRLEWKDGEGQTCDDMQFQYEAHINMVLM